MNRLKAGLLLVTAVLWTWTSWLLAEPDPAQVAWLDGQGVVVHWDNIEGAPDWLQGPVPQYRHARRMHELTLQPGESVLIRVPARAQLRLVSAEDLLRPGDVGVEWSNGGGLYVKLPLRHVKDDGSLQTEDGELRGAGVMRVTRPVAFDSPVSVALFRSRQAAPVNAVRYRSEVEIPNLPRVRLTDHKGADSYQLLAVNESATVPVDGTKHYRLDTRVLLPASGETSQQSYRIEALLDGEPWQVFEFETSLESRAPVAVDGCYTPLGQRVRGYLQVPDGARQLQLRSTAPVYLRLQGRPSEGEYLWPGNRSLHHAAMQSAGTVSGSIWDLNTTQVSEAIETAVSAGLPGQQLLQRLLQDNQWRDGGLTGSALARLGQRRYPDYTAVRQQAERAWTQHTRYRDLLPVTLNVSEAQQFAWFRTPVWRDEPGEIVVPETYAGRLASQLASGYFLEVPAGPRQYHEYLLPSRGAASRLRITIARNAVITPTRFYVQFDEAAPQELQVVTPADPAATSWLPGRAEAALAVLNHRHGARGQTLSGPFAARQNTAPLLDADSIELALPRETQRLRIWRYPEQGASVRLALQYRGSRPYQLSGAGYQALLQTLGTKRVFRELRMALTRAPRADEQSDTGSAAARRDAWQDDRAQDLYNQWLPLLHLLHDRADRFTASAQAGQADAPTGGQLAGARRRAMRQAAIAAMASGDRVSALDAWSAVWRDASGKMRDEAALERVTLLEQLGEAYLAEQQLRGLLVDAAGETTRAQALQRLLLRYRRAGNDEAVLNVLAAVVVHEPKPVVLRELADSLQAVGKSREALQVAMALPAVEQPRQLLLEASYALGWWTVFETQLTRVRDTPAYYRWAGLQAQALGDYAQALAYWAQGDASTAALRQQLSTGLDIRTQLASADAAVRRLAVSDWEQWQSRLPGPVSWQAVPQLVSGYAGAETLYRPGQDQSSIAFRATPDEPLTLRVHGPVTLRISARGLHPGDAVEALDDWVSVAEGSRHSVFPVTDNRPAQGLQLNGVDRPLPGMAERFEYPVAPGPHEIRIAPQRAPLLFQVAAARPRMPLTVLPPLTTATVEAALQGRLGAAQDRPPLLARGVAIDVLRQCGRSRLLTEAPLPATDSVSPPVYLFDYHTVSRDETLSSIAISHATTVSELARLNDLAAPYTLRVGQRLRITPAAVATMSGAAGSVYVVKQGDTLYSIARQQATTVSAVARLNDIEAPYNIHIGQRLQLGKAADITTTAAPVNTDSQVLEQMRGILWLAEHDDRQTLAMVASGEALYQQHPDVPGLQRLLRRLRRAATWQLVSSVRESAGVRVVEVPPGLSENPAVRVRTALLPAIKPGEQLLSGYETLVFAVDQPARTDFHIDLTLLELTAAGPVPLQVHLQLDDSPARTLLLTAAQPGQSVTQPVPAGKHLLRIRISKPVLNQYLRVFIREQGSRSRHLVTTRSGQRTYHVATRDEPVVVDVEGPTRLRIDELREGRTTHRYRNVAAGWQRLRLEAGPDQEQALLRIYRLTARESSVPVPARLPTWTPAEVPLPSANVPVDSSPTPRVTIDRFALGGQEDGTWSLTSALQRRNNSDEESGGNVQAEDFMELRATHRFYSADRHSYFRTDLLTRLRDEGGPTLGVRSWVDIRRPDWPVEIALGGSLYNQRPDDVTGNEWSATVRGALSRQFNITPRTTHKPLISAFHRWLSMDEGLRQHPGRVDQDVFAEYKHDHRRGLAIADMLTYRPWLDTLLYGSLGAVSNEDFNVFDPDHVVAGLGARQVFKNWQASAEYKRRHYFQDQDRNQHANQNRYQLSLDWLGWRTDKHGWHGRAQLVWDDSSREFTGFLSVSWIRSNARFYRDFRPAERGFRPLRRRQLQEDFFATGDGGMF